MMESFFSKLESYLGKFQRHPFQLIFINTREHINTRENVFSELEPEGYLLK